MPWSLVLGPWSSLPLLDSPRFARTVDLVDISSDRDCSECVSKVKHEPLRPVGFGDGDDGDGGIGGDRDWSGYKEEAKRVLAIALPSSFVDSVSFIASVFPYAQIGQLGTAQLSALTLGTALFNITGLSVMVGLTSGLDTVCGQVYGAGVYGSVGVVFQRGLLVCLLLGAPSYLLWWRAEPLLLLLGQAPDASRLAAQYLHRLAPALALTTVKLCCRSYFSVQSVVLPVSLILFTCTVLSPVLNFVLITKLSMGLMGAAWAYVAEEALAVVLLVALMAWQTKWQPKERRTWAGFDRQALAGWRLYLEVAGPATAMVVCDWWCLDAMVLLAGMGTNAEVKVSAMGLCFNVYTFVYFTVNGFGTAAAVRVANNLGTQKSHRARVASLLCLGLGLAACCGWCAVLIATASKSIGLFTSSSEVQHAVAASLPCVVLAVLGYSCNTVLGGVLRGAGRQATGMWVNLVTLWLVGLPAAVMLSLGLHRGNVGLWEAIALMNLLQGGCLVWQVLGFNWAREVARSQSRVSLHTCTAELLPLREQGGAGGPEFARRSLTSL